MTTLLPALEAYLQEQMVDVLPQYVKLVAIKPEAYYRAYINPNRLPAIYLWSNSRRIEPGIDQIKANELLTVSVTILMHSSDQYAANWDPNRGVHALEQRVYDLVMDNKKLGGAVDGLNLPYESQSFQYTELGTGYAVGSVSMLNYERRWTKGWHGMENNESPFV